MANELTANTGVLSEGTEAASPGEAVVTPQAMGSRTPELPAASPGGGGFQLKPFSFRLTMPPPDDFYFVRDGDLDNLTRSARDYSLDIAIGCGGAAIGFAQNVIQVCQSVYKGEAPS